MSSHPEWHLLALVKAPLANGKTAWGTAYPVGPDLLLTANHVVAEATDTIQVMFVGTPPSSGREWDTSKCSDWFDVQAKQVGSLDAAVLTMTDKSVALPFVQVSTDSKVQRAGALSRGFPKVGERQTDDAVVRAPITLDGVANLLPRGALGLVLDRNIVERCVEDAQGASGAPVVVAGCLVGVLSQVPERLPGTLQGVGAPQLLADREFVNLVSGSALDRISEQLSVELQDDALRKVLGSELEWAQNISVEDAKSALLTSGPTTWLPQLITCHQRQRENLDRCGRIVEIAGLAAVYHTAPVTGHEGSVCLVHARAPLGMAMARARIHGSSLRIRFQENQLVDRDRVHISPDAHVGDVDQAERVAEIGRAVAEQAMLPSNSKPETIGDAAQGWTQLPPKQGGKFISVQAEIEVGDDFLVEIKRRVGSVPVLKRVESSSGVDGGLVFQLLTSLLIQHEELHKRHDG